MFKANRNAKKQVSPLTSLLMFSMMTLARRCTTVERSRSARTMSGTITASVPSSMACGGAGGRCREAGGVGLVGCATPRAAPDPKYGSLKQAAPSPAHPCLPTHLNKRGRRKLGNDGWHLARLRDARHQRWDVRLQVAVASCREGGQHGGRRGRRHLSQYKRGRGRAASHGGVVGQLGQGDPQTGLRPAGAVQEHQRRRASKHASTQAGLHAASQRARTSCRLSTMHSDRRGTTATMQ